MFRRTRQLAVVLAVSLAALVGGGVAAYADGPLPVPVPPPGNSIPWCC
jgi:hypothetical protein